MNSTDWIILITAFCAFALFVALEWLYWRRKGTRKFDGRDTLANYGLLIMQILVGIFAKILFINYALDWFRDRGPKLMPDSWWAWIILFLGVDLAFYLFHRASHRVRFLWAIHESHHSSELMNLSVALRQPPLEPIVDWPFFILLAWIGFSSKAILTMYAFNLFYQFFIHTEIVGRLPRLIETVFNTPSHHRVHHGTNPEYIDRNYGGVLIIWDRIFGSFTEERSPARYGVLHPVKSFNPIFVGFHIWLDILRDAWEAKRWGAKLNMIFAPPGWADEYRRKTGQ